MAVVTREAWTDERLDDLSHRVDEGFREMREEFRAVRAEMATQFAAQNRMMMQLFVAMMIGFLGVIATMITTA